MSTILSLRLGHETDVVLARQRARQIAGLLEFDAQDQTRIATAVSEIARNAFRYARGGRIEFRLEGTTPPQLLAIEVRDQGPGIADVAAVLEGRYRSTTGMGLGLIGVRRLMDRFEVTSSAAGTTVIIGKLLPRQRGIVRFEGLAALAESLARQKPRDPVEEIQQQNQELLRALEELHARQDELVALNGELEDTNRGVVALYAELDERADHLRRADEIKSRFLSNMSHEFRTPVNSIQALARLLLDRVDGDLTPEQERQVTFIRNAAQSLGELVNDLLDLTKAQAGKVEVRPVDFEVENLFGALRGMLRPLLVNEAVSLVFDEVDGLPPLYTDESKVSQILRNFISNAIKFTERGEVRVSARMVPDTDAMVFSVRDTGIGIAPEDLDRIFQEFAQVDSPVQRRVTGTGLGLPLCRQLAELLGGEVRVESVPGRGSTFTALVPLFYSSAIPTPPVWDLDPDRLPVLLVEDRADTALLYDRYVMQAGFQVLTARSLREAEDALRAFRPHAIVLDILLKGEDAWDFLAALRRRPDTSGIPIVVVSRVDDERKALALGADAYCEKPIDKAGLVAVLRDVTARRRRRRILVVDDEEIGRYLLCQQLAAPGHELLVASGGQEALRRARAERPDVVCLDLVMPDLNGFEVMRRLKADQATRDIPIVVVTSYEPSAAERLTIDQLTAGVLDKQSATREGALAMVETALGGAGAAV